MKISLVVLVGGEKSAAVRSFSRTHARVSEADYVALNYLIGDDSALWNGGNPSPIRTNLDGRMTRRRSRKEENLPRMAGTMFH